MEVSRTLGFSGRKTIDEHESEDLLVALLETLIWLRWGWERMEVKKLTAVTVRVTLGCPER